MKNKNPDLPYKDNSNPLSQNKARIESQFLHYQSPLPPPEILEKYEKLKQGLIERMMILVEKQVIHRLDYETEALKINSRHILSQDREALRGQWMGFILSLLLLILGAFFVYNNNPEWATFVISLGFVFNFTTFLYSKSKFNNKQKNSNEKNK